MGLLDYIRANTPRSTRPAVRPATVFNEGLLNPNAYNKPAADRFKDSLFGGLGIIPGVSDAASAAQAADLFNRGENFAGSMAALGALPIVPNIAGMFIGKGAKTWDALAAQKAEEMLSKGVDPREVWKQTGTMRGVDKALRQEIPDNAALFGNKRGSIDSLIAADKIGSISPPVSHAIMHSELDAAYPNYPAVMDIPLQFTSKSGGHYQSAQFPEPETIRLGTTDKSTLLHELQHAIQQREGWAKGGSPEGMRQELADGNLTGLYSPEELNNAYRRLAGEAEARLTQNRMNMTMPERLQSYPYDMLDVPQNQLIVRGLLK